jgi:hypothetical protein
MGQLLTPLSPTLTPSKVSSKRSFSPLSPWTCPWSILEPRAEPSSTAPPPNPVLSLVARPHGTCRPRRDPLPRTGLNVLISFPARPMKIELAAEHGMIRSSTAPSATERTTARQVPRPHEEKIAALTSSRSGLLCLEKSSGCMLEPSAPSSSRALFVLELAEAMGP